MRRFMLPFVLAALSATANPIVETFINEFSADTVAGQWLELHVLPEGSGSCDLSGWQVLTSASVCTLRCTLDYYRPYVVIDSAGLARGENGSGTFRLNPLSDSILLVSDTDHGQLVAYPCDSTTSDQSLRPPPGGSASIWYVNSTWGSSMNWYVDSTPTPGRANDDYSTISGTLLLDSMPAHSYVCVLPRCRLAGGCVFYGYMTTNYDIMGLGPGWYRVDAFVHTPRGTLRGSCPDSVWVGYAQTVSGVDIDLRSGIIVETPGGTPAPAPVLQARGSELNVLCPSPSDVSLIAYDLTGRQRLQVHQGRLSAGRHRFDLTSRVAPGIYIVRAESRHYSASARLTVLR